MTGQTGAFIYMAPEVLMGTTYNEKVDVFRWALQAIVAKLHRPPTPAHCCARASAFTPPPTCSFGMVFYELLHRKLVVADLMYLGDARDAEAFAYKVGAGPVSGRACAPPPAACCEAATPASVPQLSITAGELPKRPPPHPPARWRLATACPSAHTCPPACSR